MYKRQVYTLHSALTASSTFVLPIDVMMAAVFIVIEFLRRTGLGDLEQPIQGMEADALKDW